MNIENGITKLTYESLIDVIKEIQNRIVNLRLRVDKQDEILRDLYVKITDLEDKQSGK